MKVLQINNVFRTGSTGKITDDIHTELQKRNIQSIVCYGRGNTIKEKNVYKVSSELYSKINHFIANITGLMYGGCFFSTSKLFHIIKKEQPDIVHIQCPNGYFVNIYRLLNWLKKHEIPTVLTLHAEFMYTANCGYAYDCNEWKTGCNKCIDYKKATGAWLLNQTQRSWKKMAKSFRNNTKIVICSVSPWLMNRAKESPFLSSYRNIVIKNGLNTDIFHYYKNNSIKEKYGISYDYVFHATPSFSDSVNDIKGGKYIIELAKRLPKINFVIAGPHPDNLDIPHNIKLLGPIYNQTDLAKLYSAAKLTVITSKKETFSMIVAESLSCGTPVIGFLAGGPESISIPEFSQFVPFGDINNLVFVLEEFINNNIDSEYVSKVAVSLFSKQSMCGEYLNVYSSLLSQ